MKTCLSAFLTVSFILAPWTIVPASGAGAEFRPAMIGGGPNSVAARLHYPPKERAANRQAAVSFSCEVRRDGKPSQIAVQCDRKLARFGTVVDTALRAGRFEPAQVGGKPVDVAIGGTVLFTIEEGKPTIAVSLVTADKEKIIGRQNYIQPQLIGGPELRRKLLSLSHEYNLLYTKNPGAEVMAQVDAQGNLSGTRIVTEAPAHGSWGPCLVKGMESVKFIPAMQNGHFVAGEFNYVLDAVNLRNPDYGPTTGSWIKDKDVR